MKQSRIVGIVLCIFCAGCSNFSDIQTTKKDSIVDSKDPWITYNDDVLPITFSYPTRGHLQIESEGSPYRYIALFGTDRASSDFYMSIKWVSDLTFYNPPAHIDVNHWVMSDPFYAFDGIAEPREIDGIQAVHVKNKMATPFALDIFYVLKGTRLYEITVHDLSNPEVAHIENRILDSIRISQS
jgi:hypothetical protein